MFGNWYEIMSTCSSSGSRSYSLSLPFNSLPLSLSLFFFFLFHQIMLGCVCFSVLVPSISGNLVFIKFGSLCFM
jgi:hypothetical protein